MLEIKNNTGALVASETQGTLRAIDDAILSELRLCTTVVEAFGDTDLTIGSSQKLLQSLATGLNHFVAGRGEMAQTVRTLTAIKSSSSLRETSYNCPGEAPSLLVGNDRSETERFPAAHFG